ncbi:uncharacterized protein LOC135845266 [Planococcus citri]|uniref:uncharacterized protein LOC135845266 n=1 Tax=Planococcus citri TaxID=170843 RepID=UPI0031F9011F
MTTDQRHERNDFDESNEDCYIYLYVVPSLQEIASHEIVREIWHRNLSTYPPIKGEETNVIPCNKFLEYCDEYVCQQQSKEMITHLKVPHRVEEKLKNSLRKFCEEITRWVAHLLRIVFRHKCLRKSHEIRGIDPKWCIWSIYGKIDYEKSARKILEIGSLTDLHKFLIMCEFYMEDEIKKFSLNLLPSEFIEKVKFSTNRSCFYWICFLKNELWRMPVQNPLFAYLEYLDDFDLFEHMSKYYRIKIHPDCRYSNKFFWYRLSKDDQVRIANAWICYRDCKDFAFLEQILSEMSWYQQQCLLSELSERPFIIIARFAMRHRAPQMALWIWKHFKNEMAVEQFARLFCDLICNGTSMFTLLEIWETASDHQKDYFISNMSEEFISSYSQSQMFVPSRLMTEIFRIKRNMVLKKTTQDVMPWHDRYLLNNILDNCSPCSNDQLTSIKLFIDSFRFITHLQNIFSHRNFQMFEDELKAYFLHDVDAARAYKRLFLEQVSPKLIGQLRLITNVNLWNEFSNYIEDVFENDVAAALKVKRRFLSHMAYFSLNSQCYFDLRRGFDDLEKIVESVFESSNLRHVRYDFSSFFSTNIKSTRSFVYFDKKFGSKFRQWCLAVFDDSLWPVRDLNTEFLSHGYDESTSGEDEEDMSWSEN